MALRSILALLTLLTGTIAMAQEDTIDTGFLPTIDGPAVDVTPLEPDSTRVLMVVEEMPEFPGGMPALSAYMSEHLKYPKEARELRVEGLVLLQFIVEKDGSIGDIKVIRGIGRGCDEEAVRVVQQLPTWKPGQHSGKPVRVQFSLPIRFKLTD